MADLREQPAYTLAEAARYVKVADATLRAWVVGRDYPTTTGTGRFRPLIHPAERHPARLSFSNLIEAHVLRALRSDHGVSLKAVRAALRYAEESLGIERLLLRKELSTTAGQMFLRHYGQLINLSASGQIAMQRFLQEHLKRVEWDKNKLPIRLYPFVSTDMLTKDTPIVIDPQIAFGRPVLLRKGISTSTIAERIDAGETIQELAEDYDLTPDEVEQAVLYERAA